MLTSNSIPTVERLKYSSTTEYAPVTDSASTGRIETRPRTETKGWGDCGSGIETTTKHITKMLTPEERVWDLENFSVEVCRVLRPRCPIETTDFHSYNKREGSLA